jgi:hypothetical protein
MMPHKLHQEERFYEKARQLKDRFVVGAADSLFLSDAD